jgi:hypothetical protein
MNAKQPQPLLLEGINKAEFDLGFEMTFNTQHGKQTMFFIMQEFLGGRHLEHKDGTCYDRHLNAIYKAIKVAKIRETDKQ